MISPPSYNKILTLGARGAENVLRGSVVVQEKVDGSQFRFGVNEDGELVFASHHKDIYAPDVGVFTAGVDSVTDAGDYLCGLGNDTYFFGEYLAKPHQNTLTYERVPRGHVVVFDALVKGSNEWETYDRLYAHADAMRMEIVPLLQVGEADLEFLQNLVTGTQSFLGGTMIEGVVIKNYRETVLIGSRLHNVFAKLVRAEFKERNIKTQKRESSKGRLLDFLDSFGTEARWRKAVQRAREDGDLEDIPRDIGMLVRLIQQDVAEEETENIKEELLNIYKKDVMRHAVRGFAEWYKEQLLTRMEEL